MKLRPYQEDLSSQAKDLLKKYAFVFLSMEVRTWKTITALETIKKFWAKKVLFLTKKKAISSIEDDYSHYKNSYKLVVTNYESLHKITENNFDLIVLDESHWIWTFPKPNNKFKDIKKRFGKLPMILLSWTMSPENFSQLFHQFFVSANSPWKKYTNFYKWAKDFVTVRQIRTSYGLSNDYSNANYWKIMQDIWHLILTYTQKQAGFTTSVDEKILHVKMKQKTHTLVERLQKDKVIEWRWEVILADTTVKEQQKVHQLYSWTIKFESWNTFIVDKSKWEFIKDYFTGKKIWIFYNFKAEKDLLKEVYWDQITDDLEEFKNTDKNIMLQIVSWREGISLKEADFLVFYNIAFSALSYWQARDRLTTMERKTNTIYWIFAEWWLEDKIYKSVQNKKNFTSKIYKEWKSN